MGFSRRSEVEREGRLLAKRDALPQNSQSPSSPSSHTKMIRRANRGNAVPFGEMLSYGPNGSPTITLTKTLFSAGEVTSTTSAADGSSATDNSQDGTTTSTTTGTSTVSNIHTVTSTRVSSTSSTSSPRSATSSNASTSIGIPDIAPAASATLSDSSAGGSSSGGKHGRIAGGIIGSMAAFGMIGVLIWYLVFKKQGKHKLKATMSLRRRQGSEVKTPQLEQQSMEQTRAIMLQQVEMNKSRERDINAFIGVPAITEPAKDLPATRGRTQTESSFSRPSWIGMALSSTTPPDTPPLPRSNSQRSTRTAASVPSAGAIPISLVPGAKETRPATPSSLIPAPLKPGSKPAPIITSPRLNRPENLSPLSPRGILNSVSSTTSKAWKRASEALSPSSYQKLRSDEDSGFDRIRSSRQPSMTRNPEMEIGAQTDGGWNGQWI